MRPFDKRLRVSPAGRALSLAPFANNMDRHVEIARDLALIDLGKELSDIHAHGLCACICPESRTNCAPLVAHGMFRCPGTLLAHFLGMSRAVKPHREILADLLRAKHLTNPMVAKRMGWKSPRSVAHKLRGTRDWATGELERMCKIAGITLVQLAEMSNDIHLTKTSEAVSAARMVDELSFADRERALQYLKGLQGDGKPAPEK